MKILISDIAIHWIFRWGWTWRFRCRLYSVRICWGWCGCKHAEQPWRRVCTRQNRCKGMEKNQGKSCPQVQWSFVETIRRRAMETHKQQEMCDMAKTSWVHCLIVGKDCWKLTLRSPDPQVAIMHNFFASRWNTQPADPEEAELEYVVLVETNYH